MTGQPHPLARLALGGDDERCRGLYWRGPAVPDGAGLRVEAGGRVDLGTWFNAAPVGWWRAVLGIDRVHLSVAGAGELAVFRSAGRSGAEPVTTLRLHGTHEIDLPATDVAFYWLQLRAADAPGRLESVCWGVEPGGPAGGPAGHGTGGHVGGGAGLPARRADRVTVVVPTFGREQDALDQVRRLLDPALADVVARVVLVDQARTVRGAPGADAVLAAAGERLLLVEQDNLGGSGGYARGMLESLAHPDDAVLLLDDDAVIEPEGLRRMLALSVLAGAAGAPTIIGTPLLSAERPTQVEALTEGVRRRDFVWGPSDGIDGPVDVSVTPPAAWTFADPLAPVDYTGWWGTLLPPGAVGELGLPVPYFLKWDDAEYGLRARRAGYRVATVPGTAAWHPTWAAKGTISSWAAWPLHRNRLATAAAYGAGRGVLLDSLVHQIKHVLSLQYQTAELWDAAMTEFAAGPGWLRDGLRGTRARAQAVLDRADGAAPADGGVPVTDIPAAGADGGRRAILARAVRAAVGLVRRADVRDAVRVAPGEFTWRAGLGRDAVVLDGVDRALVRDPARARAAVARTVAVHGRTALRWAALRRSYARALPASRTPEQWRRMIGER